MRAARLVCAVFLIRLCRVDCRCWSLVLPGKLDQDGANSVGPERDSGSRLENSLPVVHSPYVQVLLVVVVLLAFGRRTPLFELRGVSAPSSSSGVLSPVVWLLWRGPMTLLQGPVGVVVWTVRAVCSLRCV